VIVDALLENFSEERRMTAESAARKVVPLLALGGASALTAAIAIAAPDVGLAALSSLIVAWVALGVVRVIILLGVARQLQRLEFRL
jgi:hypothetical protein